MRITIAHREPKFTGCKFQHISQINQTLPLFYNPAFSHCQDFFTFSTKENRLGAPKNRPVEGGSFPATATCFLRDENYLISKKHVLSAVENYDHTCFYVTDHPDAATLRQQIDLTMQVGMARVKPRREYMSSDVSLVILADTIDEEAKKLIKKTRF